MPLTPAIAATVKITAKDINGNNIAKQFSSVRMMSLDFSTGKINVVDATGSFYFSLSDVSSLADTIVTGISGGHTVVIS